MISGDLRCKQSYIIFLAPCWGGKSPSLLFMVAEVLLESVIYTCTQTGVLYNGEFLLQEHTDWPFFKELTEGCAVVGCGLWQPLWMIQFLAGVTKNLECHEDRNFGTTVVAVRDLCTQTEQKMKCT
ncbi:uncharacterized protein LOC134343448 isoform X3 [Mobula hypostoma]|uniref:uncharacterized protein LOC134343448 isoform X3 n=1 Tax=Mobula hypostoma TaxID=723540 RepID=UPI002FC36B2F